MKSVIQRSEAARRRMAMMTGAVVLGLAALALAYVSDAAQTVFRALVARWSELPLVLTPVAFGLLSWVTGRYAPEARGSGIPQIIARAALPDLRATRELTSLRTALFKFALTVLALGAGASVGREGPTVQISAAIMRTVHRLFRVRVTSGIIIAGGAAGISAAFNTPLAGVAFAIEELASSYEQKVALMVMVAVMTSGLVSLGLSGDYLYFGASHEAIAVVPGMLIGVMAGGLGGLSGGVFSRALLSLPSAGLPAWQKFRARPVLFSIACGLVIALIGMATRGLTWGTSYEVAKSMVEGTPQPFWFAPAKLVTTLVSALAGFPGGIFAPSLAAGAGLGDILAGVFTWQDHGSIVLLGMIAYFTGVVRSPLTAVLIISEMTDSRSMLIPLFVAALVADYFSAAVCPEKLYHGLARAFQPR